MLSPKNFYHPSNIPSEQNDKPGKAKVRSKLQSVRPPLRLPVKSSATPHPKTPVATFINEALSKTDKLELVLPRSAMTAHEMTMATDRLQEGRLTKKVTSKSGGYHLIQVLRDTLHKSTAPSA